MSSQQMAQCEVVRSALVRLSPYIVQSQEDPEKFGQSIMEKETAYKQVKNNLYQAEKELEKLKQQSAAEMIMNRAISNRDNLRNQLAKQKEEIKIMLGIIGLNSPE